MFLDAFLKKLNKPPYIIVIGGGAPARSMIRSSSDLSDEAKDRLGIAVTRANARLFIEHAAQRGMRVYPEVVCEATLEEGYDIYVLGGLSPGRTTDDVAVQMAIAHDAKQVVNLTNIDGVYDKDPAKEGAKMFSELDWDAYLSMFSSHEPGMHAPFDPVAAARAKEHAITVLVMKGEAYGSDPKDVKGTRLLP
jgi:uridylate kinase